MPYHSLGMEYSLFFFFNSSTCLSPTSPPPLLPLWGKSQEHSSIRKRHGTFSSDSLKQEWANTLSSFFSATVCWHKVPSGTGTFHRCWKILLKCCRFFMWPVGNRFVLHTAKSVKVHRSGYAFEVLWSHMVGEEWWQIFLLSCPKFILEGCVAHSGWFLLSGTGNLQQGQHCW